MFSVTHRLVSLVAAAVVWQGSWAQPAAPVAAKRPVEHVLHDDRRVDDYGWLREKESPEVIAYLEAENTYTDAVLEPTGALQETLYGEMLGRLKETDVGVPSFDNGWWYSNRTEAGKPYPVLVRRAGTAAGSTGAEQVVLDENALAAGHEYFNITTFDIDPTQRWLAFAVDTTGYETTDVWIKDLETGAEMRDVLKGVSPFNLSWGADGRTLYYARFDESKRDNRIYRHVVGTDPATDELIAREDDVRFGLGIGRTRSDELLVIGSNSTTTSEVWVLDATDPGAKPRSVAGRTPGVLYGVDHRRGPDGGWLYVTTDDGAPNFKVLRKPVADGVFSAWEEVVGHDPGVYITGTDLFGEFMVVSERRGGFTALRVIDHDTGAAHVIETPERVGLISGAANPEYDAASYRFAFQSPITPSTTFEYDIGARTRTVLKQTEIPSGHDPSLYTVTSLEAIATDGTRVPMSIVHLAATEADGTAPALLYGYGSYGIAMDPVFRRDALSLVDRGFVYAIAHVRGGGEMGRHWKEDGRLGAKMNTFTDFIACAEALVDAGYAAPGRLAIEGGSAGGLLIGAVINMRPDLFKAAHAAVPFVDVMNTMLDASIPLTTGEYEEWGNPNEREAYFTMKAYSPYDNVRSQAYPDLLITAGLNDPRVHYWEPAKWCARLRATKAGDSMVLLRTNMGAGHGGASGRYEAMRERAEQLAFFIDRVGGPTEPVPAARRPATGTLAP